MRSERPRHTSEPHAFCLQAFPQGIQLRIAQQNAKGGVNDRTIVLTNYDDQGSGATQTAVVNKPAPKVQSAAVAHG